MRREFELTYEFDGRRAGSRVLDEWTRLELVQGACDVGDEIHVASRMGERVSSGHIAVEKAARVGRSMFHLALSREVQAEIAHGIARGTTLSFCLDPTDCDLPWELIHDSRDFVGLQIPITRALSAPGTRSDHSSRATFTARVLTDPTGDLPAATKERDLVLKAIASGTEHLRERGVAVIDVAALTGPDASKRTLLFDILLDPAGACDLLHFIGHGLETADLQAGGLMLSDGVIRGYELEQIICSPFIFAHACHSAAPNRSTRSGPASPPSSASVPRSFAPAHVGTSAASGPWTTQTPRPSPIVSTNESPPARVLRGQPSRAGDSSSRSTTQSERRWATSSTPIPSVASAVRALYGLRPLDERRGDPRDLPPRGTARRAGTAARQRAPMAPLAGGTAHCLDAATKRAIRRARRDGRPPCDLPPRHPRARACG